MNRFAIREKDHPEITVLGFRDLNPSADPAVGLHFLAKRCLDGPPNPLVTDSGSIGASAYGIEVTGRFQLGPVVWNCRA